MSSLADHARRLLDVAPAEYVAERGRLARVLRQQGERAEARELQALVRPTLPLWAVLAAGADPTAVRRLYAATDRLATVQAGGAGRDAVAEAADGRRRELEALVDAAVRSLAAYETSAAARRPEIRRLVDLLSRRADAADEWITGVLRDVPTDDVGFSAFDGFSVPERRPAAEAPPAVARRRSTPAEEAATEVAERDELEAARARRRLAARAAFDDATREVARAGERVDRAADALRLAERNLREAHDTHSRSVERRATAAAALEAAAVEP